MPRLIDACISTLQNFIDKIGQKEEASDVQWGLIGGMHPREALIIVFLDDGKDVTRDEEFITASEVQYPKLGVIENGQVVVTCDEEFFKGYFTSTGRRFVEDEQVIDFYTARMRETWEAEEAREEARKAKQAAKNRKDGERKKRKAAAAKAAGQDTEKDAAEVAGASTPTEGEQATQSPDAKEETATAKASDTPALSWANEVEEEIAGTADAKSPDTPAAATVPSDAPAEGNSNESRIDQSNAWPGTSSDQGPKSSKPTLTYASAVSRKDSAVGLDQMSTTSSSPMPAPTAKACETTTAVAANASKRPPAPSNAPEQPPAPTSIPTNKIERGPAESFKYHDRTAPTDVSSKGPPVLRVVEGAKGAVEKKNTNNSNKPDTKKAAVQMPLQPKSQGVKTVAANKPVQGPLQPKSQEPKNMIEAKKPVEAKNAVEVKKSSDQDQKMAEFRNKMKGAKIVFGSMDMDD